LRLLSALLALLILSPAVAHAAKYSHGVYAEMDLGGTGFIGSAGPFVDPGPNFGIRAGYDLFSWLSVGGVADGSTHEANVPPPPDREFFQLYHVGADGRLTARVGRFALFGEGSLGAVLISTNVLDKVMVTAPDTHATVAFTVGGGVDYHTQNRHYSIGIAGDWTVYPSFSSAQSVTVRIYLRYTR
jgi:hypothetical protein